MVLISTFYNFNQRNQYELQIDLESTRVYIFRDRSRDEMRQCGINKCIGLNQLPVLHEYDTINKKAYRLSDEDVSARLSVVNPPIIGTLESSSCQKHLFCSV